MPEPVIPMSFEGEMPDWRPDDALIPPETLQVYSFVRFERIGPRSILMRVVTPGKRWACAQPLYQVGRPAGKGGYALRRVPSGGLCGITVRALRRIRGHGRTVMPSEAFGFLLGWPDEREIHAALPVGRTHVYRNRADLFRGVEAALPIARSLAAERGLSVVGLYCAMGEWQRTTIEQAVPAVLGDGYLLTVPAHGTAWEPNILARDAPPHGWLTCPWHLSHRPVLEAALNPRRIHSAWLERVGPIDYARCSVPEPVHAAQPRPASEPERDWFSAERHAVDPALLGSDWQWLTDAVATPRDVRIRYAGGSMPGAERTIRPLELFTVTGYEAVYLRATDVELDEERVFRLDRLSRQE